MTAAKRLAAAAIVLVATITAATGPARAQAANLSNGEAIARMIDRLGLSAHQEEQVRPIIRSGIVERLQILEDAGIERGKKPSLRQLLDVRPKIEDSRSRTENQLARILTPAQMTEYRMIVQEQREKMRERFRNR